MAYSGHNDGDGGPLNEFLRGSQNCPHRGEKLSLCRPAIEGFAFSSQPPGD